MDEEMGSKNGAMPAGLDSKEGTNREGTRGASKDVVGSQAPKAQSAFSFYGSPDGRNDVIQRPEVKSPTKPSLNP